MSAKTEPVSIKVHKTSGNSMEVAWKDGHQSNFTFVYLRDACPCALCKEEREKDGRQPGDPIRPVAGALPLFKAMARPEQVEQVGQYAIRFKWNDGHEHGIYSYDYLREWCPCPQCKMERESTEGLREDMAAHERKRN